MAAEREAAETAQAGAERAQVGVVQEARARAATLATVRVEGSAAAMALEVGERGRVEAGKAVAARGKAAVAMALAEVA